MTDVGVTLVVHARYDTPETPAEELRLCVRPGGRRGAAPELHLFNWTGGGLQGYHYDALVRVRQAHVEVVDVEGALPHSIDSRVGQDAALPLELDPTTVASSTEDIDRSRPKKRLKAVGTHQARHEGISDSSTPILGSTAPDADLEQWEEELRKLYTPAHIVSGKCQARMFGGGKGGQCTNIPKQGRTCGKCGVAPKHGFVTGRVPKGKWKAFGISDELVRQLQSGGTLEKPGSGDLRLDPLDNDPPLRRQTAGPTFVPAPSVRHVEGQEESQQPTTLLKRPKVSGLGRSVCAPEPDVAETAGASAGEPPGTDAIEMLSVSSRTAPKQQSRGGRARGRGRATASSSK